MSSEVKSETTCESRHTDGMQLKWTVGGKSAVLNLSGQQLIDHRNGDVSLKCWVQDFISEGISLYELLQEESRTQTEEG